MCSRIYRVLRKLKIRRRKLHEGSLTFKIAPFGERFLVFLAERSSIEPTGIDKMLKYHGRSTQKVVQIGLADGEQAVGEERWPDFQRRLGPSSWGSASSLSAGRLSAFLAQPYPAIDSDRQEPRAFSPLRGIPPGEFAFTIARRSLQDTKFGV
jgi:hypothetical protein